MARDLANGQPLACRKRGSGIEAEAPAAHGLPILARCVAPAGKPVGKGERQCGAELGLADASVGYLQPAAPS